MAHGVIGLADTRLNLFEPIGYLDSTLNAYTMEVPTKTSLDGANVLEFTIDADSSAYTDLYSTAIYVRVKVTKENGSSLADTDK